MDSKLVAKMIDHSLLHPTMTDEDLISGCELAKKYDVASVCIKPYAVKSAVQILKGTDVKVGTVIGFPQGGNVTEVKVLESEISCREGAAELDMVVNIGKVLCRDWDYVEKDIRAVFEVSKKYDAIVKVIFENDFLYDDEFKIKLCEICGKVGVHFVKTSSGYGFVKGEDGKYSYKGATDYDLTLMRKYTPSHIKVKAAGCVRTLDDLLRVHSLGVTRIGATATEKIILDAREKFGR